MKNSSSEYEAIIGLEIHAQLLTQSKLFCSCGTNFGEPPNSQVCPICLGHPGVLPVLNEKAVELAIRVALAASTTIRKESIFARKNYFYPDLPKSYQISQYEKPLAENGILEAEVDGEARTIGLKRIHLEEDAGKSFHPEKDEDEQFTFVDLNRCGVPLIEIVTEPDIRSPKEAHSYLLSLKQLLEFLEVCDGNMEKGSLRCDANVSVRLKGEREMGTKSEIKNINSFKGVEKGLSFEIERQIELLKRGERVKQETLLWDPVKEVCLPMRSKEEAHDYRYFPEPDLLPLVISGEMVEEIRKGLPELPNERRKRFIRQYGLPQHDAWLLTSVRSLADYYEAVVSECGDAKTASNWIMTEVLRIVSEKAGDISSCPISSHSLSELILLLKDGTISGKIAKTVFEEMAKTGKGPRSIVEEKGFVQVTDEEQIREFILCVLKENQEIVTEYLGGKSKSFTFLVGQTMKLSKGMANPELVNRILREELSKP
ncbi:MAG: Asp-tRNA(Asn)/Glu-tRNA(Gln) amidotransferase subunit GatB [Candidatus Eisenbacteria bacterium]|nr:Asp-tRNA(Asn)/Glu-tRNA(Gln) amidotransferase subunit GatB [Candidatus Eisenbacteria bacterium]